MTVDRIDPEMVDYDAPTAWRMRIHAAWRLLRGFKPTIELPPGEIVLKGPIVLHEHVFLVGAKDGGTRIKQVDDA